MGFESHFACEGRPSLLKDQKSNRAQESSRRRNKKILMAAGGVVLAGVLLDLIDRMATRAAEKLPAQSRAKEIVFEEVVVLEGI